MAAGSTELGLYARLKIQQYNRSDCTAAIRGECLPHSLGLPLNQLCIVRAIRYNPGFGEELHGILPVFTRALNARRIMSNTIPDIEQLDDIPYCIWHPETASEETYREVALRYPLMSYQVGRACAVAGYTALYRELGLKPDVHIAEEARESGNFPIYELIMSQPVRYSIMDDYKRVVDPWSRKPVDLNGDTAACWMLDIKQEFSAADPEDEWNIFASNGFRDTVFNITEDQGIDETDSDGTINRTLVTDPRRVDLQLLCEPLPRDLPTVQKDLLIQMAAYYGNIERYSRLRRPQFIDGEVSCCVRGIYHNPLFAVWMSKQDKLKKQSSHLERAINARFIMNNVLSGAPYHRSKTPYLIWRPTPAKESTYRQLYKLQPDMLPQILRSCIYAGYKDLFDQLLPHSTPDLAIIGEAANQGDLHFRNALTARVQALGITAQDPPGPYMDWKLYLNREFEPNQNMVYKYLSTIRFGGEWNAPYDGLQAEAWEVEMNACLPEAWQLSADDEQGRRELDYLDWPPTDSSKSNNKDTDMETNKPNP